MNRPIKYRFWDKHQKKMYYNVGFSMVGVQAYKDELIPEVKILDTGRDNGELLEFTGLHDKHGKEIYEGDVVSGKGIYEKIKSDKFKVIYHGNKCSACFIFADKNGLGYHPYEIKAQEIIGNIYENPDLIVDTEANEYPEGCKKCCS